MLRLSKHDLLTGLLAFGFLFSAGVVQAGFAVDGSLLDWGGDATLNFGLPNNTTGSGVGDGFTFQYHHEDSSDTAGDTGPLGPNHGGQNYDGEFLGVGQFASKLLIAIVTGQRPDNGFQRYAPGDIRITTSDGSIFGIEVGGGAGGGSGSAITEGASGSTYSLNSNGYTSGHTASPAVGPGSDHKAGALFLTSAANWILDPISGGTPPFDGQQPVQLQFTGGTFLGMADFIYTRDAVTSQKAAIELAIDLSLFGSGVSITSVQWAPSCGNDVLHVGVTPGMIQVPEPASFLLGLLGVGGIAGVRRIRRRNA